jgi:ketosteroid isomerase-like protein
LTNGAIVRAVLRANDRARFAELMAVDGVIEWPFRRPGAPARLEGREAIREYVTRSSLASLLRFEDLRPDAVHETGDPEVIVIETTTIGSVVETGRRFELPAIAVLRVRDGEIVSTGTTSTRWPPPRRRARCRGWPPRSWRCRPGPGRPVRPDRGGDDAAVEPSRPAGNLELVPVTRAGRQAGR